MHAVPNPDERDDPDGGSNRYRFEQTSKTVA
jgi:hypothetical protein